MWGNTCILVFGSVSNNILSSELMCPVSVLVIALSNIVVEWARKIGIVLMSLYDHTVLQFDEVRFRICGRLNLTD